MRCNVWVGVTAAGQSGNCRASSGEWFPFSQWVYYPVPLDSEVPSSHGGGPVPPEGTGRLPADVNSIDTIKMSKKPPNRPGIEFEVGARLEAQDCLQKWYSSRIEKIDYEEGKMLVHFERWNHRYDEWIFWDSSRLRPLERPALRKEGLKDEEELFDFKPGEEVLARWTDCRYYPAKIEAMSPEGTYTVQFYDGVIRCLKKMHIKCMPDDARGQDWIALVKAAAAAVGIKSKAGGKPRTSANSNKEKEDKKSLKVTLLKENTVSKTLEEVMKKEEAPTSSEVMGSY